MYIEEPTCNTDYILRFVLFQTKKTGSSGRTVHCLKMCLKVFLVAKGKKVMLNFPFDHLLGVSIYVYCLYATACC